MEIYLHNGDDLLPVGGIRCVILSCSNQPIVDLFLSHLRQATRAVQINPEYCPGNLLLLRDGVLHQKWLHLHGNWLSQRWNVPVYILPILRHGGNGHFSWGRVGGGGGSTAPLYHPCIHIHASQMRGGLDARRYYTSALALDALWRWYYWILSLIKRLIPMEVLWDLV